MMDADQLLGLDPEMPWSVFVWWDRSSVRRDESSFRVAFLRPVLDPAPGREFCL
jgi:hypothetical protein